MSNHQEPEDFDDDEEYHVIPINEFYSHIISSDCRCKPVFEDGAWIHNPLGECYEIPETLH